MIETVDSLKLAGLLDKHLKELRPENPLNILVQVNTSGEESKSGIEPSECVGLVETILKEYKNLNFRGLMTIGAPDATPEQPDFKRLVECRKQVCEKLKLEPESLELSMGMSHDYEVAVRRSSSTF